MFQTAHAAIIQLIQDFDNNHAYYLSPNYSEAEARQDFVDKFFTALGWDVAHHFQKNPYQQEVKVEKTQKQEGESAKKRADYAFYLAPEFRVPKFFVEAKKPSRTLRQNTSDYFQTAKYGWNAGTGVSILTDFEEFVIIDCRFRPDVDTALQCELNYYRYTDFLDADKFAEIYWLFSHEAVQAGNLATYIDALPNPKNKARQLSLLAGAYQAIDESFLAYIDNIRLELAKAFHLGNPDLTGDELTEATTRTIDRLVFMRFLEDKMIEPVPILNDIANAKHSWTKFVAESKRLDIKYNGIVFKPHLIDEPNFLGANEALFKEIATDFDHTNSPYDFNYIPIYVLGNIYERFLGKVIEINNGRAVIENKPAVRKAGGVFYTPKYVVDYIVEHTVGNKIDNKSLNAIKDLTICDMACGSGSFLIGVYEYLLNFYKEYYNKYPSVAEKDKCIFDSESGQWTLTIHQKQKILTDHIYGVDIDIQAIEVTQLSLFLKLLEDESMATVHQMNVLFSDKILPDLTQNIKCGNSLINYSIMGKITDEQLTKINPFDWQSSFPKVFKNGGFDIIVGNPPYVKEYTDRTAFEMIKLGNLSPYYQGKMDLWYFFVCYGLDLLKDNGKLGYIAPNNWVSNAGASILRNKVLTDSTIERLVDFSGFMVFDEASIQTMILVLEKSAQKNRYPFFYQVINNHKKLKHETVNDELWKITNDHSTILNPNVDRISMQNGFLKFNDDTIDGVLDKIANHKNAIFLDKKEATNGIHPHYDFVNKKIKENYSYVEIGQGIFGLSHKEKQELNLSDNELSLIKPYYNSSQIYRYYTKSNNDNWIIYTTSEFKNADSLDNYPNLKKHLDKFGEIITSDNKPYGLHRAREERFFKGEKIICQRKCVGQPVFSYSDFDCYVSAAYYVIKTTKFNLKYLTAILNSRLIAFWLKYRGKMQGDNYQIDKEPLLQIPLVNADDGDREQMAAWVESLIIAYQNHKSATTEKAKNLYHNQIVALENNINNKVYDIYGLTAEERAIVAG